MGGRSCRLSPLSHLYPNMSCFYRQVVVICISFEDGFAISRLELTPWLEYGSGIDYSPDSRVSPYRDSHFDRPTHTHTYTPDSYLAL